MNTLIIETPHLQNLRQRYGFAALTLIFWGLWFYMWLPLISMIAWVFGVKMFYLHMIELGGYVGFLELLGWYTLIVFLIAIIFGGWMLINLFRFRGRERRKPIVQVNDKQVAEYFGVDSEYLSSFTGQRSVTVHQTQDGSISAIVARS